MTGRSILVVLCLALLPGCGRMDQPTVREIAVDGEGENGPTDDDVVCPGSGKPGRTRTTLEQRKQAKVAGAKTAKKASPEKAGPEKAGQDLASSDSPDGSKKNNPHGSKAGDAHSAKTTVEKAAVAANLPKNGESNPETTEKTGSAGSSKAAGPKAAQGDGREVRMGSVRLTAPKSWTREQPPIDVILAAFSLPRSKGDSDDADVTVTPAGVNDAASMEQLREHLKQESKDGSAEHLQIGGNEVVLIESTGKNSEDDNASSAPAGEGDSSAPAGEGRYRSLNATVFVGGKVFFVNCSGPEKTVGERSGEFRDFLKTMKSAD